MTRAHALALSDAQLKLVQQGAPLHPSAKPNADFYVSLLPLLNSRRIELLDNAWLITQLTQ